MTEKSPPVADMESSGKDVSPASESVDHHDDHHDASTEEDTYLTGYKLVVILVALCLSNFLVALDTTIIATAIPVISHQFRALEDVGWYESAYFLTNCAFQLLYGKFYSLYPVKPIYIGAMAIFEIGSLICAVAPSSPVFIFGRALAGLGAAGTFAGALIIIVYAARPEKRAAYSSMITGMFGIASIAGPLIGGAFTSHVTWRWCFYINLPIGGAAMVGLLFFLRTPKQPATATNDPPPSLVARIMQFDPLGSVFFLASIICLLLALQLGGTKYPFSNGRIIAIFVLFGVLLIAFLIVQSFGGKNATIPTSILKNRSILFGMFYMFCVGVHFFVLVYYLPIWLQGVRGRSPLDSCIDTLPILLVLTIFIVLGGIFVSVTGYYIPLMWISVIMASVGAGLLTTLEVDSSTGKWIGYQIIYGIGGGIGYQQGITAAQTVLSPADVAMGTALMVFVQNLGWTIFISVANNVFVTSLVKNLGAVAPSLDAGAITSAGATGFQDVVTDEEYPLVLIACNRAVREAFRIALIFACLGAIGAAGMEWKRATTKGMPKEGDVEESKGEVKSEENQSAA